MPTAPVTQQAHAPSAAGPFEEFRVQLERLRTHCVKERAHASLVAAGYGGDPVEWARSTMLRFTLDDISAALARIEARHVRSVHPLRRADSARPARAAALRDHLRALRRPALAPSAHGTEPPAEGMRR